MKTAATVLACLVASAVYIPAAFFIGRNHIPAPRHESAVVETIGGCHFDNPDQCFVRPRISQPDHFPDTSRIAVDQAPTLQTGFTATPDSGDDVIRTETVDGSHLRRNERDHWAGAVSAEDVLSIALAMSALYAFVRLVVFSIKR